VNGIKANIKGHPPSKHFVDILQLNSSSTVSKYAYCSLNAISLVEENSQALPECS